MNQDAITHIFSVHPLPWHIIDTLPTVVYDATGLAVVDLESAAVNYSHAPFLAQLIISAANQQHAPVPPRQGWVP